MPKPTRTRPPRRCKHCGETHRKASLKQARFASEYQKDLNATRSAIAAGYSKKSASSIGRDLIQKSAVACAIQRAAAKVNKRAELSAEFIIDGLMNIAGLDLSSIYDDHGNLLSIHAWPEEVKRVVVGMESDEIIERDGKVTRIRGHARKLKLPDRIKAFELLGKHLALFTEITRHEGEITMRERIITARKRAGLK